MSNSVEAIASAMIVKNFAAFMFRSSLVEFALYYLRSKVGYRLDRMWTIVTFDMSLSRYL